MRKKILLMIVVASFLSVSGVSAFAAESKAAAATEEAKAKKKDPNAKVCKRIKDTGTSLLRRVCLKQKEWDRVERENARNNR